MNSFVFFIVSDGLFLDGSKHVFFLNFGKIKNRKLVFDSRTLIKI